MQLRIAKKTYVEPFLSQATLLVTIIWYVEAAPTYNWHTFRWKTASEAAKCTVVSFDIVSIPGGVSRLSASKQPPDKLYYSLKSSLVMRKRVKCVRRTLAECGTCLQR
jgi:hypothetical protein